MDRDLIALRGTTAHQLGFAVQMCTVRYVGRFLGDPLSRRAVEELRTLPAEEREGEVLDEDVARISPLKHANLNVLGRYSFRASTPGRRRPAPAARPGAGGLDEDDDRADA